MPDSAALKNRDRTALLQSAPSTALESVKIEAQYVLYSGSTWNSWHDLAQTGWRTLTNLSGAEGGVGSSSPLFDTSIPWWSGPATLIVGNYAAAPEPRWYGIRGAPPEEPLLTLGTVSMHVVQPELEMRLPNEAWTLALRLLDQFAVAPLSVGPLAAITPPTSARQTVPRSAPYHVRRERTASVRKLHLLGSPALRQRSTPVATLDDDVRQLVDDLFATMRKAKGVGLAANQVGVPLRVAVVDVGEDDPGALVLINPRIVQASDVVEKAEEGCLSIPDIYGDVERPLAVTVEALDYHGRRYRSEVSGLKARAVQHEIDHLDGLLFLDHLSALKRSLLLSKWRKSRKDKSGYLKDLTREPPGEL